MKRRRTILLLALAAVAALVLLCWPRGPKEPVYEGRLTREWVEDWTKGGGQPALEAARKALRATSPASRRYWMSEFAAEYPKWLGRVNNWLVEEIAVGSRVEINEKRIARAAYALYLLGPELVPALPELTRRLGDEERGLWVASAMIGAGDAALPFFLTATNSTNALAADAAREGIEILALESEAVLPTLFAWLQHADPRMRRRAVHGLRNSNFQTNRVISALTAALSDPDGDVIYSAAYALATKREVAKPAIPALLPLMTNSNRRIAIAASNAVFRIDPAALPPRGP